MGGIIAAIAKGAVSAILGMIAKALVYLGVYEAGKKAEAQEDDKASLKDAVDERKEADKVAQESDAQLNSDLGKFVRGSSDARDR